MHILQNLFENLIILYYENTFDGLIIFVNNLQEEKVSASLKAPTKDIFNPFKVPLKPVRRIKLVQNKPRPKQTKPSVIPLNMLPSEVLEDMKYKPPKRFQPSNASWITKRLYKFLENKLEPK